MTHIVLTAEQAQVVRHASGPIDVRDGDGILLARITPPHEEALVREAKRRLENPGPRYSGAEVQARLKKLEEIAQRETLTPARVKEFLDRMRAGEEA